MVVTIPPMADAPDTRRRAQKLRERQVAGVVQDLDDLKKRLTDEYKILQDKMDKIGAFRFTIKGWAIAAVGAAAAAASGTKSLGAAILVSFGLGILVVFFFLFEVEQVRLSRLFGYRSGQIEQAFNEIDNKRLRQQFQSPIIGTEIVKAKKYRKRPDRFRWWMVWRYIGEKDRPARQEWRREIGEDWTVSRSAHITFYLFLLIFAFTPVAVQHNLVVKKMASLWSFDNPPPPAPPASPHVPQGGVAR